VRKAIAERADLSAFRQPPTFRILAGVFAICISFPMSWPAIGALGGVAIYFRSPWIIVIGGPVLYGLSHLCFLTGMALSGEKYSRIFLRWVARVSFERFAMAEQTTPDPTKAQQI
jgi:hypothetical protein